MAILHWELQDGVAVVTLDTPGKPVNVISRVVKEEMYELLAELERDPNVRAVAFFSAKPDNFIAGADIDEFRELKSVADAERLSRDGQALLDRVATFTKPIVAGIHGACLGGGLEFALACRYRIGTDHPKTQIGLPEIQLGILPAAGGCQRLPRLIGARAALDLILSGRPERAVKAYRLGIVDELVPPSILRDVATAAARRLAQGQVARGRSGGFLGLVLDGNPLGRQLVFRLARNRVLAQTRGNYPAPLAALDAVHHGLSHGMREGLKREAQLFGQLALSDISRKLVNIFFATTELKKDRGAPGAPPPAAVHRLAVVGSGFMGASIAGTAVVQAGIDVRLKDSELARVAKGLIAARDIVNERLTRRRITKYEHARLVAFLSGSDRYTGFGSAELVIEAVFEELGVKQQVLRECEEVLPAASVFASNTSTIPIARIAEASRRPEQVIGMHFFSPVPRMPLLEVIPTTATSLQTTSTAVGFGRRLGKTVIVVEDTPGFWVNRILGPYMNEAAHLLLSGVRPDDIDAAMVQFGFPVGPITLLDEVGIDVAQHAAEVLQAAFGERLTPPPALAALVKDGRLGRKAGKGFYTYTNGTKGGVDASIFPLLGVQPNGGIPSAEIVQRLTYAMLNEAARAAAEGVVRTPRDGDIGAIYGFGFPPFRGGPLHYLDDIGSDRIYAELQRLAERLGARFTPSEAIVDHARSRARFYP